VDESTLQYRSGRALQAPDGHAVHERPEVALVRGDTLGDEVAVRPRETP